MLVPLLMQHPPPYECNTCLETFAFVRDLWTHRLNGCRDDMMGALVRFDERLARRKAEVQMIQELVARNEYLKRLHEGGGEGGDADADADSPSHGANDADEYDDVEYDGDDGDDADSNLWDGESKADSIDDGDDFDEDSVE